MRSLFFSTLMFLVALALVISKAFEPNPSISYSIDNASSPKPTSTIIISVAWPEDTYGDKEVEVFVNNWGKKDGQNFTLHHPYSARIKYPHTTASLAIPPGTYDIIITARKDALGPAILFGYANDVRLAKNETRMLSPKLQLTNSTN